jgi:hypothetical protein
MFIEKSLHCNPSPHRGEVGRGGMNIENPSIFH